MGITEQQDARIHRQRVSLATLVSYSFAVTVFAPVLKHRHTKECVKGLHKHPSLRIFVLFHIHTFDCSSGLSSPRGRSVCSVEAIDTISPLCFDYHSQRNSWPHIHFSIILLESNGSSKLVHKFSSSCMTLSLLQNGGSDPINAVLISAAI